MPCSRVDRHLESKEMMWDEHLAVVHINCTRVFLNSICARLWHFMNPGGVIRSGLPAWRVLGCCALHHDRATRLTLSTWTARNQICALLLAGEPGEVPQLGVGIWSTAASETMRTFEARAQGRLWMHLHMPRSHLRYRPVLSFVSETTSWLGHRTLLNAAGCRVIDRGVSSVSAGYSP